MKGKNKMGVFTPYRKKGAAKPGAGRVLKGVGKMIAKKGLSVGKGMLKKTALSVGKKALTYGNKAANTAIRGGGAAASSVAGNPLPSVGAEVLIRGKDALIRKGVKKFMKGRKKNNRGGSISSPSNVLSKSNTYYPTLPKQKVTPRDRNKVGISKFSHAYDATDPLKRPARGSTPASTRNIDHHSSAPRPTGSKI